MSDNMIAWEKDADGVVVLTMDDPNQGANTMNDLFQSSLKATVERLEAEKDDITGVVLTSAKKTFFAGGDLKDMTSGRGDKDKVEIATEITNRTNELKSYLRRLETFGKPVVSAINGAALGGLGAVTSGIRSARIAHHIRPASRGSQRSASSVTLTSCSTTDPTSSWSARR